ncbi:MAG: hypothetical protein JNN07_10805 [Verrucomicrobiales bacterium]|nr:hypothetical protein [Verrucomicrobiales bacterium]
MKITLLSFLLTLAAIGSHAQGSLTYTSSPGGVGKEKYVFKPDPANPTVAKVGGALADYAGFSKVDGTGYTAELWYALGPDLPETSLRPVPGSQVGFRTGATAGLFNGKSKLDIVGTFGGDRVTLQLRVWNNEGGKISDWEQATERGKSRTFNHELAGVAADGSIHLGTGSIFNGITHFSLAVPEPSGVLFALLSVGLLRVPAGRKRLAKTI